MIITVAETVSVINTVAETGSVINTVAETGSVINTVPSVVVEIPDLDMETGFVFSPEHAEGERADGIEGFVSIPIEGSARFSASPNTVTSKLL